jgi:sarcosine oxidase subunit gamma
MSDTAERRSPVHHLLDSRGAEWGRLGDALIALGFAPVEDEAVALRTLAVCDLSALPKWGVKGRGAETWLRERQIVPQAIYDTRSLGHGGFIARLGSADFFLEGGISGRVLPDETAAFVYRVERHDAAFLLAGSRSLAVLAQLCSIDFRSVVPGRVLLTRAAGVNCMVLPEPNGDPPSFRLWVDPSYAVFFWETLVEISEELGGKVVGAACVYPNLLNDGVPSR